MARKKASNSNKMAQLPKGFKAISGFGNSWRPEKPGEMLQGKYVESRAVDLPKKGRIPARTVNVHTIANLEGSFDIFQSGGLKALETLKKGQTVCILFRGLRKIPGMAQPMKDYVVGVK